MRPHIRIPVLATNPGPVEPTTCAAGFSSSDEDPSALALSKCITIIDYKNMEGDDVAIIQEVVERMVEFASYQTALAFYPGITLKLERYQVRKPLLVLNYQQNYALISGLNCNHREESGLQNLIELMNICKVPRATNKSVLKTCEFLRELKTLRAKGHPSRPRSSHIDLLYQMEALQYKNRIHLNHKQQPLVPVLDVLLLLRA